MLIYPGDRGLDWSFDAPDIAAIRDDGYRFVCRYLAPNSIHPKALKPLERDELFAHGIGILLVYEDSSLNPLRGRNQGLADGSRALVQAIAIGYPIWLPIIVAIDTGITPGILPTVLAYWDGFQAACPRPLGVYGGSIIADALANRSVLGWKAVAKAWSPNPNSPNFHVHQTSSSTPFHDGVVDFNRAVRPFSVWTPTVTQPVEETEMLQLIQVNGDPAVMVTNGDRCWSAVSNSVILANRQAKLWSDDIMSVSRDTLAGYYWSGKPIDYTTVNPDVAATYPGRTHLEDFRGYES